MKVPFAGGGGALLRNVPYDRGPKMEPSNFRELPSYQPGSRI